MTRGDWQRVSKGRPCPVCGKPDWCLYAGPADAPTAAICARIESPKRCGAAGWWHRLRDADLQPRRFLRRVVIAGPAAIGGTRPDFARLAAACAAAVRPQELQRLADTLGLSVKALQRFAVGWSSHHAAWTFPMQTPGGDVVGVRLRLPSGRKLAVRGGKEGLFLPADLDAGGRLLICEGPTDAAALVDLGFSAVGRPSCTGGVRLLAELVKQRTPAEVVIVADGDGPGIRGAQNLAAVLSAYCAAVRVITPPAGIKDAREWKQHGATAADLAAVIDAAPVRRLPITIVRRKAEHGRQRRERAHD